MKTSARSLRDKYGVVQDAELTKYVTLVGSALAQVSSRPALDWKFIVLDTDGVNAFAAPGGLVHITRGLLGLMKNESELAGVLGHEITHVTARHTVRLIQKSKGISVGSDLAGGGSSRDYIIAKMSEKTFHLLLDGEFSRDDERESDKVGVQLANKLGYAPNGLAEALKKIEARNSERQERNGLFASHPAIKERIESIEKQVKDEKLTGTATVASSLYRAREVRRQADRRNRHGHRRRRRPGGRREGHQEGRREEGGTQEERRPSLEVHHVLQRTKAGQPDDGLGRELEGACPIATRRVVPTRARLG